MKLDQIKTHTDGIWISERRERATVRALNKQLIQSGFEPKIQDNSNFGYPYVYSRDNVQLNCRLVDSAFPIGSDMWGSESIVVVTDNYPLRPMAGKFISALPEFWSIWQFDPVYIDRPAGQAYNCFMNRSRGDRSIVFYELIKRNILNRGIVSFNCSADEYQQQFVESELYRYNTEHQLGKQLVPYNTVESHGTLEQCIIDSNVSLVLETYTTDDYIVFSEKIFRALQLPRPWLLYCSTGSVGLLTRYGFDVLEDYVDHTYDSIVNHADRLAAILDQFEMFIDKDYTAQDYARFKQAAENNNALLKLFEQTWPARLETMLNQIQQL
jgi:hypothetical protein